MRDAESCRLFKSAISDLCDLDLSNKIPLNAARSLEGEDIVENVGHACEAILKRQTAVYTKQSEIKVPPVDVFLVQSTR